MDTLYRLTSHDYLLKRFLYKIMFLLKNLIAKHSEFRQVLSVVICYCWYILSAILHFRPFPCLFFSVRKKVTCLQIREGKFINGNTIIVDGGLWLSRPRHLSKEAVKQVSRAVEKRSRDAPVGVPRSKM